jgi:hypothetical protein
MRQIATLIVVVMFVNAVSAAVRGDHAEYVGGTANIPKGSQGKLDLEDRSQMVFSYHDGSSYRVSYASITSLEFGQKVGRRVGATIALGVTTLGLGALPLLFSKKKKHFLTVGFSTSEGNQVVVFELAKDTVRTVLPTLEARTGKKVELQESNEGEAYTTKTASQEAKPPTVPPTAPVAPSIPVAPTLAAEPVATATPTAAVGTVKPTTDRPSNSDLVDVTFASNPAGALVSFGGMSFARTPFVTKLQPGKYPITMALAGFAEWKGEITVEAGKSSTVVAQMEKP